MVIAVGTLVIVLLWGTQLMLRFPFFSRLDKEFDLRLFIRNLLIVGGIAVFLLLVRQSWFQYSSWQADSLAQYFLPPHNSISYFIWYEISRTWAPWLISLMAAVIGKRLLEIFNRRMGERFFEQEEPAIFAFAVFFTGYPGIIFYGLILGLVALIWTFVFHILKKGRAPLYLLWLPSALFAILITYVLLPKELLLNFNL